MSKPSSIILGTARTQELNDLIANGDGYPVGLSDLTYCVKPFD